MAAAARLGAALDAAVAMRLNRTRVSRQLQPPGSSVNRLRPRRREVGCRCACPFCLSPALPPRLPQGRAVAAAPFPAAWPRIRKLQNGVLGFASRFQIPVSSAGPGQEIAARRKDAARALPSLCSRHPEASCATFGTGAVATRGRFRSATPGATLVVRAAQPAGGFHPEAFAEMRKGGHAIWRAHPGGKHRNSEPRGLPFSRLLPAAKQVQYQSHSSHQCVSGGFGNYRKCAGSIPNEGTSSIPVIPSVRQCACPIGIP